jgi:hypothetical protein
MNTNAKEEMTLPDLLLGIAKHLKLLLLGCIVVRLFALGIVYD